MPPTIIPNVNKITYSAMKPAEINVKIAGKTRTDTLGVKTSSVVKEILKAVHQKDKMNMKSQIKSQIY